MQIFIYGNDKLRNSTKTKEGGASRECLLKKDTGIVHPIIEIKGENMSMFNYAFIPDFHRYYYIVEWTSLNAHMWQAQLEVDVLATYREHILASDAFVQYAESDYNTMIPDPRLPKSDSCQNIKYEFPLTYFDSTGCIVLSVVSKNISGRSGMAESFAMSPSAMASLAQAFIDPGILEQLNQYFQKPLDMVLTATWIPIDISQVGSDAGITIGDWDSGVSGKRLAFGTGSHSMPIAIQVPYQAQRPDGSMTYADYRNCEPYTQYTMTLPGVGQIQIPMISLLEDGESLPIPMLEYSIDFATGDIVYRLEAPSGGVVLTAAGNVGVPVPVANNAQSVAVAMKSAVGTVASTGMTIGSILTGNVVGAGIGIGGMTSNISNLIGSAQHSTMVNGQLGGKANAKFADKINLNIRPYLTSDSVYSCRVVQGGPCFKRKRLGELSGYVKCSGVLLNCNATAEEYQMLSNYLEASANYQYGGIIIE